MNASVHFHRRPTVPWRRRVPPENPELMVSVFKGVSAATLSAWLRFMRDVTADPPRTLVRVIGAPLAPSVTGRWRESMAWHPAETTT